MFIKYTDGRENFRGIRFEYFQQWKAGITRNERNRGYDFWPFPPYPHHEFDEQPCLRANFARIQAARVKYYFFPLPSPPPFLSARKVSNLRSNPPLPVYTFSHSLFPFPRFHYWRDGKIKFHDSYTCIPLIIGKGVSFSRWRSSFFSIYIDFSLFQ